MQVRNGKVNLVKKEKSARSVFSRIRTSARNRDSGFLHQKAQVQDLLTLGFLMVVRILDEDEILTE